MNVERVVAGVFVGAGALLLIYEGYIEVGTTLLGAMLGFFVGEANGARNERNKQ